LPISAQFFFKLNKTNTQYNVWIVKLRITTTVTTATNLDSKKNFIYERYYWFTVLIWTVKMSPSKLDWSSWLFLWKIVLQMCDGWRVLFDGWRQWLATAKLLWVWRSPSIRGCQVYSQDQTTQRIRWSD
jgi:hypothetical protein